MSTNENRAEMLKQFENERKEVYEALGYVPGEGHIYVYAAKCEAPLGNTTVKVRAQNEDQAFNKAYELAKKHPLSTGELELVASTRLQTWAIAHCAEHSCRIFKNMVTAYASMQALKTWVEDFEVTSTILSVHHYKEV